MQLPSNNIEPFIQAGHTGAWPARCHGAEGCPAVSTRIVKFALIVDGKKATSTDSKEVWFHAIRFSENSKKKLKSMTLREELLNTSYLTDSYINFTLKLESR